MPPGLLLLLGAPPPLPLLGEPPLGLPFPWLLGPWLPGAGCPPGPPRCSPRGGLPAVLPRGRSLSGLPGSRPGRLVGVGTSVGSPRPGRDAEEVVGSVVVPEVVVLSPGRLAGGVPVPSPLPVPVPLPEVSEVDESPLPEELLPELLVPGEL
ncbi:hypothetical protein AB0I91_44645, partial [Actinosynnema sp. NPDC049800]